MTNDLFTGTYDLNSKLRQTEPFPKVDRDFLHFANLHSWYKIGNSQKFFLFISRGKACSNYLDLDRSDGKLHWHFGREHSYDIDKIPANIQKIVMKPENTVFFDRNVYLSGVSSNLKLEDRYVEKLFDSDEQLEKFFANWNRASEVAERVLAEILQESGAVIESSLI